MSPIKSYLLETIFLIQLISYILIFFFNEIQTFFSLETTAFEFILAIINLCLYQVSMLNLDLNFAAISIPIIQFQLLLWLHSMM